MSAEDDQPAELGDAQRAVDEARAALAAATTDAPGGLAGPDEDEAVSPWRLPVAWSLEKADEATLWEYPEALREGLTDASVDILDSLFPSGPTNMDGWGPWSRLAYFSTMLALANFDWSTRRFRPLLESAPESSDPQAQDEGPQDGQQDFQPGVRQADDGDRPQPVGQDQLDTQADADGE